MRCKTWLARAESQLGAVGGGATGAADIGVAAAVVAGDAAVAPSLARQLRTISAWRSASRRPRSAVTKLGASRYCSAAAQSFCENAASPR